MTRVLIGYDGSECATAAIDDLRLAGLPARGVEALVLSVKDVWPGLPGAEYARLYPEAADRARKRTESAVAEARASADTGRGRVSRLFPDWSVASGFVTDSPYWGLVAKAQARGADLKIVGSHGK